MHHARWMAKAIYSLKIFMFRTSFRLTSREENSICDVCIFLVLVYVKAWFCSSNAIEAPYHDLQFIQQLSSYETIDSSISRVALKKFCGQLWYLTAETAALGFFDAKISVPLKKRMVAALKSTDGIFEMNKRLTIRSSDVPEFISKGIDDFISMDSNKLFVRFGVSSEFLNEDPSTWNSNQTYIDALEFFKSVRVVNDVAERGVKLMDDYNKVITKKEEQKQSLLQVVQDYRKTFPDCKRSTMSKQF